MNDLPHLRLEGEPTSSSYSYAGGTPQGVMFDLPARNQPAHARDVRTALETADAEAKRRLEEEEAVHPHLVEWNPEGIVLTFQSEPNHPTQPRRPRERGGGIHLLGMTEQGGTQTARVFVPERKLTAFLRLVDAYASSIVLTYLAEPANVTELRALQNEDDGIRFWGPVYKTREGKAQAKIRGARAIGPDIHRVRRRIGHACIIEPQESETDRQRHDHPTRHHRGLLAGHAALSSPRRGALVGDLAAASRQDANEIFHRFLDVAATIGIDRVSDRYVSFPERLVLHAYASARQISSSMHLITMIAELRKAKELATPYVTIPARDQRDFVDDARRHIVPPARNAPSVCILDAGVNQPHPLLSPALAPEDVQAVEADWGTADHHPEQHGTGMAGNALYGCLTELMTTTVAVTLRHRLESVKFLPPPPRYNEPPVYGRVMQDAVALAQIQSPRRNRVICMAVTADDRDLGMPTTWSAAVDDMCAGVLDEIPKLMFISAGNVLPEHFYSAEYEYHQLEHDARRGSRIPASPGTRSPSAPTPRRSLSKIGLSTVGSRSPRAGTSPRPAAPPSPWPDKNRKGWPIKPDIVMEGGNYAQRGDERSNPDDLSLMTTILHPSGRLLEVTRDTSPATALAARFAAIIWSRYPRLSPRDRPRADGPLGELDAAMRRRFPGD